MNITNRLNRKIELYNYTNITNLVGELSYSYTLFKSIYAQVLPISNKINDLNLESEKIDSQYKFVIRKKSFNGITVNTRIRFEDKEFKIDYWNIDYKNNEYIEIFATLDKGTENNGI